MPPVITASGPQIDTYNQVVSDLLNGTSVAPGFYSIYGSSINVASNSPDGQMINIFATSKIDMENFGVQIYDSLDPDEAIGIALDNSGAYSGTPRKGGVYTQVAIQVIVSMGLNLSGQDTSNPYTIQDGIGNQFQLVTSASLTTGSNTLTFQAVNIGFIQVLPNTLTTPVTIIAGVTSVNNSAAPSQVGANQETDANYRLRLQFSRSFPSQGALDGLYAGLNQLTGVDNANVYENDTSSPVNGIPANGIWVVTNGGTAQQIAQVIYNRRNLGVPMKGSQTYDITQANGTTATMKWDNVVLQALYVTAFLQSISGASINIPAIKAYLVANWKFKINQPADISMLNYLIGLAQPGVVSSGLGVSPDGSTFYNVLAPSSQQNQFYLITANINLNLYP